MSETYRLGCPFCGDHHGCRCNEMATCRECETDYFPGEDDIGLCQECEQTQAILDAEDEEAQVELDEFGFGANY